MSSFLMECRFMSFVVVLCRIKILLIIENLPSPQPPVSMRRFFSSAVFFNLGKPGHWRDLDSNGLKP